MKVAVETRGPVMSHIGMYTRDISCACRCALALWRGVCITLLCNELPSKPA